MSACTLILQLKVNLVHVTNYMQTPLSNIAQDLVFHTREID
jgi:hypothetical protein